MAAMQSNSLTKNENPAYQNTQHGGIKNNKYNEINKKVARQTTERE